MSTLLAAPFPAHNPASALQSLTVSPTYVNPSHIQNAHAGPSSPNLSITLKKKPYGAKRKRTDTTDQSCPDSSAHPRKGRDGPKKKKANRACFHCQKAHLTCDDSRPCQRCVKRGIASNCTEGHRKKAKYLLDEDELEQLKRSKSSAPETSAEPPSMSSSEPFTPNEPLFPAPFDSNFPFGSEAANLEYSILSAILGNHSTPESEPTPPPQQYPWPPADSLQFSQQATSGYNSPYSELSIQPSETTLSTTTANTSNYLSYPYSQRPDDDIRFRNPQPHLHALTPRYPLDSRPGSSPSTVFLRTAANDLASRSLLSPSPSNGSPSSTTSVPPSLADPPPSACQDGSSQLQSINDRVTVPYDYTEGYHFLMKHLPSRFEKNDILRIVRALAIFRPSLIALQMPLSLDDEVFVEKCFQRSLLELDKLISFSGTPTVVWRRTGEICLVAPEFCMLTEWSMEELVGRKKYIYELFEDQSVVEYWENFASHAFENSTHSVYSHCVLLKPSGTPVPSTFCFSIRRDLFDLPSAVIGQWLPLL